jgi:hypothetical protein
MHNVRHSVLLQKRKSVQGEYADWRGLQILPYTDLISLKGAGKASILLLKRLDVTVPVFISLLLCIVDMHRVLHMMLAQERLEWMYTDTENCTRCRIVLHGTATLLSWHCALYPPVAEFGCPWTAREASWTNAAR